MEAGSVPSALSSKTNVLPDTRALQRAAAMACAGQQRPPAVRAGVTGRRRRKRSHELLVSKQGSGLTSFTLRVCFQLEKAVHERVAAARRQDRLLQVSEAQTPHHMCTLEDTETLKRPHQMCYYFLF